MTTLIHNGTLETFVCLSMNETLTLSSRKARISSSVLLRSEIENVPLLIKLDTQEIERHMKLRLQSL